MGKKTPTKQAVEPE
jgi:hypothetical protein